MHLNRHETNGDLLPSRHNSLMISTNSTNADFFVLFKVWPTIDQDILLKIAKHSPPLYTIYMYITYHI